MTIHLKNENVVNYAVEDNFGNIAGWFLMDFDAWTFILAQAKPEQYHVVVVNKIVKEND